MQLQEQKVQTLSFILQENYILCTLKGNILRIRVQSFQYSPSQFYFVQLSDDKFPDNLRHSPLNTPFKINFYIKIHQNFKTKIQSNYLIIFLEEDQPIKIELEKYVRQKQIMNDNEKKQLRDFMIEKKQLNHYKNKYFWDKSTKNAKKYMINSLNLIKIQDGWQQIPSLFPLQQKKIHYFRFKIIRFGGNLSIGFGVIKSYRKNQIYSGDLDQQGSIGIWSKKKLKASCICSDGAKVHDWDKDLYFEEGSVFNIEVDLIDRKVTWSNTFKKIENSINNHFFQDELFIYCVMHDKGSQIQLIQQK